MEVQEAMNIGLLYSLEEHEQMATAANPKEFLPDPLSIHFGLSFIASALKKAGHNVRFLLVAPHTDLSEELTRFIGEFNPRMIGLTAVATQYPIISQIAEIVKKIDGSIYTVLGGVHAILQPALIEEDIFLDALCAGEGEVAVVSLADAVEKGVQPANIPNLWIRNSATNTIEKNGNDPFDPDLDAFPFIERKMWDPWIASKPITRQHVLIARGCPFKCTYCANHILAETQEGKQLRFRSPENVIAELRQIRLDYPDVESIYFEVETFGGNKSFATHFCKKLEEYNASLQKPIRYGINVAVTRNISKNSPEILDAMQRANFDFVNIGLESGSEKYRRDVLKRPEYTNEDIIYFSKMARERSINVSLYVLIGLPGETVDNFKQTIDCAKQCVPFACSLSKFFPYPGTRLYDIAKEQNVINAHVDTRLERRISVLNMKQFPAWRINYEYLMFHFRVFQGQIPFFIRATGVLRKLMGMYPLLNSLYMYFAHRTQIGLFLHRKSTRTQFTDAGAPIVPALEFRP